MYKTILGIDFGTSRTVFAMTTTKARFEPEIVEVDGNPFVETILRLDHSGTIELYGTEAWEKIDEAPDRTFYEFKMGISKIGTSEQNQPATTEVAEARFTPQQLGLMFLRRTREKIERHHFNGASLADQGIMTVIGYPAEWNEKQRLATIAMAQKAGFPNVQGCEEPLGVIYYHHYKGDLSVDKEQIMLVYDFGGGTSDVVAVKTLADEKPKVLGIGGSSNLGGTNFDTAVYNALLEEQRLDPQSMDSRDIVTMRRAARTLKEKLAASRDDGRDRVESTVTLHGIRAQKRLWLDVHSFEQSCSAMIERFPEPVWDALNRADVAPEDIDVSILAGGSARMHYVRKALDDLFPNDIVLQSTNPAEVVAKGLAIYGRFLQGEKIIVSPQTTAATGQSNPGSGPATATPNSPNNPQTATSETLSKASKFWGKLSNRGKMLLAAGIVGLVMLPIMMLKGGNDDVQPVAEAAKTPAVEEKEKSVSIEEWANMPIDELQIHAEAGNADAQYELSDRYWFGKGVTENKHTSAEWTRKAAEQGHLSAQSDLGWMYRSGEGVPQSDTQSVHWLKIAAERGVAESQNYLGLMFDEGRGVRQSDSEAVKWYRKAADQGYATAQSNLGLMYGEGRGVSQSDSEAVKWFRKAADQGHTPAQNNLGWMYQEGRGVNQSDSEAVNWYRKAADQGHTTAQNNLGWMYQEGRGVNQSYSEAVNWYRKAAEQGDEVSQYFLGYMYENGLGIRKDALEAYKWYYISSRLGDQDAIDRMNDLMEKKWIFFGASVTDADARRVEREAEDLIRSKGWR